MTQHKSPVKNWLFWLSVVSCTLYQSYRYPLQIGSSGTSPTYADTPFALQAGKFIFALPVLAIALTRSLTKPLRSFQWIVILAVLFLCGYSVFKILGDTDPAIFESSFWMLFSLISVLAIDRVSISSIDKYLKFLLIFSFLSTLIEVTLFFTVGRLPALAYEGTLSVRFGGFLDDPNGFALICFLLMGWSFYRFKARTRFLILTGQVLLLVLTQSWTAIGFFLLFLLVWAVLALLKRPAVGIPVVCLMGACVVFLLTKLSATLIPVLLNLLSSKQDSVQDHVAPLAEFLAGWSEWILLGTASYNHFESWWLGAVINYGVLWLGVDIFVVAALFVSLVQASSRATPQARPIFVGLIFGGLYFVLGSFNLPFPLVFPLNVLFFVFSFLVFFDKLEDDGPTDRQLANPSITGPLFPRRSYDF